MFGAAPVVNGVEGAVEAALHSLAHRGVIRVTPGAIWMSVECRNDDGLQEPEAARAMVMLMISPEAAPLVRMTYVEPLAH
jgi:hypothetical protein